ncbi:gasdermin-D [Dasypus novemcinctus]|uniref:gasdermin-D n=1 Tax=Dasypus novemcinctus TaxID=9361 RepID=UPI00265EF95B|nr:gasdermin-D [Dasypus novemcinctus]XP_058132114.1 gasdermin-D [Dasypus novemcinctus]
MAFEGVARSVLRELDRKRELIAVDSLRASATFRPYCLVSRKPPSSWFWRPRYTCLNLSITDILEPGAPEPALQPSGHFKFHDSVDGQLQGKVELDALGQGRIAGGAAVLGSSSASTDVCMLRVEHGTWEALHRERRLRQPEHKVLQQLRHRGDNLFVVTEVLQTQKEVEITRTQKQEGSGQFALPGAICLQGEGQGHRSHKKTVTIPAGSTLAFQVAQLVIGSDWEIVFFPDKKQRSFQPPEEARREQHQPASCFLSPIRIIWRGFPFQADGVAEEGAVVTEDLQGLRAELGAQCRGLECLSGDLCQVLRAALGQLLQDAPALQATEAALEQGLCCDRLEPQDGPGGAVLECLVLPSREVVQELAVPVLYLLGALAVLSEGQQLLMAQALDTGALQGPLELVESILEQSEPWQEPTDVSLPPGLLEGGWEEGAPTWALLEACGLRLQRGAPQVCWEPQAQAQVCALYVSLALLVQLNQDPS